VAVALAQGRELGTFLSRLHPPTLTCKHDDLLKLENGWMLEQDDIGHE
jgi:hypothetical protein